MITLAPSELDASLTSPYTISVEEVVGDMRVQTLSDSLVRIELKGPLGFEDRITFNVVGRVWPGAKHRRIVQRDFVVIETSSYRVFIPQNATSLKGILVESVDGRNLYTFGADLLTMSFLPSPAEAIGGVWIMPDTPRVVPPSWGATPPPDDCNDPHSGWDIGNLSPDCYLFIPGDDGYERLRADFLRLTGPVPMPPLYTFGYWTSRYYPYTEQVALGEIDKFRAKNIPLDLFVVDTDWRQGGSHGYEINTDLFPDMCRFLNQCRKRNVRTMFNDHPEAFAENALDPKELEYRYKGLTKLMGMGADIWWFDRNWFTKLDEPVPGLGQEVWGMRLFHDITQRHCPDRRSLIMSNVQGIDNGLWTSMSDPAAHRFPIWWSGDTKATWDCLESGIVNCVNAGILMLLPYVSEDIGGHKQTPSAELFVRYVQFGVFSAIFRPHCTRDQTRLPWDFGTGAERIISEYARLRYRLLPLIYATARQAYEDGTPLLRRCDLYWPHFKESADPTQYLFGDDLLIAPVIESMSKNHPIPAEMLRTADNQAGLKAEYFDNEDLEGEPILIRIEQAIGFDLGMNAPAEGIPADYFSVRWTGKLVNLTETGIYTFNVLSDDGVRVFIDGKPIINCWRLSNSEVHTSNIYLEAGKSYDLRVEYFDRTNHARLLPTWTEPLDTRGMSKRCVWLPPGEWQDIWTGERFIGPKSIEVSATLDQIPLFVRCGGVVLNLPQMMYTGESPWNTIIIDAFVSTRDGSQTRTLYEDDGISNAYLEGASRKTSITLERSRNRIMLDIGVAAGSFDSPQAMRTWVIRLHLPMGVTLAEAIADGCTISVQSYCLIDPQPIGFTAQLLAGAGSAAAGVVVELTLHRDVSSGVTLFLLLR